MIRGGFLSAAERQALIEIARDGLEEHRIARRANAIILLDKGWSCSRVATALLLDDDTVRSWHKAYESQGLEGLRHFGHEGSACRLSEEQQSALSAWITARLPRSTNVIGAWLRKTYGLVYSRPGLITLLHRLGFDYRKPLGIPRRLNEVQQRAFIADYERFLNRLEPDEAVVFVDAVHPEYQAQPVGCWAPKDMHVAIERTTGRQHLNIHGAFDLETGKSQMLEVEKVNAESTIALLRLLELTYPKKRRVHAFLDNATYHHAALVSEWISQPRRRIILHFIPPYCPHLNPIERCWGLLHQFTTHNRCYDTFREFKRAVRKFLRRTLPQNWFHFRDRITDNFRVISPADFRVLA
jgi:transposase